MIFAPLPGKTEKYIPLQYNEIPSSSPTQLRQMCQVNVHEITKYMQTKIKSILIIRTLSTISTIHIYLHIYKFTYLQGVPQ